MSTSFYSYVSCIIAAPKISPNTSSNVTLNELTIYAWYFHIVSSQMQLIVFLLATLCLKTAEGAPGVSEDASSTVWFDSPQRSYKTRHHCEDNFNGNTYQKRFNCIPKFPCSYPSLRSHAPALCVKPTTQFISTSFQIICHQVYSP